MQHDQIQSVIYPNRGMTAVFGRDALAYLRQQLEAGKNDQRQNPGEIYLIENGYIPTVHIYSLKPDRRVLEKTEHFIVPQCTSAKASVKNQPANKELLQPAPSVPSQDLKRTLSPVRSPRKWRQHGEVLSSAVAETTAGRAG